MPGERETNGETRFKVGELWDWHKKTDDKLDTVVREVHDLTGAVQRMSEQLVGQLPGQSGRRDAAIASAAALGGGGLAAWGPDLIAILGRLIGS